MHKNSIPSLIIGNLELNPPIIQGGMGVRVSRAGLAAAVANEGCGGTIAAAGVGKYEEFDSQESAQAVLKSLREEIRTARSRSKGVIGVNIMVALCDYENLVRTAVEEKIDMIISGAGLPFQLPAYAEGSDVKLIPVVSSERTCRLICTRWKKHFNRIPDAIIIEGIQAGGHLGYSFEQIESGIPTLEQTLAEVLDYLKKAGLDIPVIAAGGIFDGADMRRFMALGAAGVQMGTRFVCTDECDVDIRFKQAYIDAGPGDITLIKSPVGLPGRVINNAFVESIKAGNQMPFECRYQCLRTCDPSTAPYCIAKVLADAAEGHLDRSFAFAGANACRCKEIMPVKTLIATIMEEYAASVCRV